MPIITCYIWIIYNMLHIVNEANLKKNGVIHLLVMKQYNGRFICWRIYEGSVVTQVEFRHFQWQYWIYWQLCNSVTNESLACVDVVLDVVGRDALLIQLILNQLKKVSEISSDGLENMNLKQILIQLRISIMLFICFPYSSSAKGHYWNDDERNLKRESKIK